MDVLFSVENNNMYMSPRLNHIFTEFSLGYLANWTYSRLWLAGWVECKEWDGILPKVKLIPQNTNLLLGSCDGRDISLAVDATVDICVHELVHLFQPKDLIHSASLAYLKYRTTQSLEDYQAYLSNPAERQAREIQRQWVHWEKTLLNLKYREANR